MFRRSSRLVLFDRILWGSGGKCSTKERVDQAFVLPPILGARVEPKQIQGETVRGLSQKPCRPFSQCDLLTNLAEGMHRLMNCNLLDYRLQKVHAAAGRRFVVLLHATLEHLANPFHQ